jgi:hypothetical protein
MFDAGHTVRAAQVLEELGRNQQLDRAGEALEVLTFEVTRLTEAMSPHRAKTSS